jgi:hypothetical protein
MINPYNKRYHEMISEGFIDCDNYIISYIPNIGIIERSSGPSEYCCFSSKPNREYIIEKLSEKFPKYVFNFHNKGDNLYYLNTAKKVS